MDIDGSKRRVKENGKMVQYAIYQEPKWFEVYFDALKEQKGHLLAGFGLLEPEIATKIPVPSIIPPMVPVTLNIVCIGIRDLIDSIDIIPLKRLSLKFDVSGDTQDAMESNKHAVQYNSCNVLEIINVPIDIPLDPLFSPVLSVYVYDHILGIIGTRLIGICHIPLQKIVKKRLKAMLENRTNKGMNDFIESPKRLRELGFEENEGTRQQRQKKKQDIMAAVKKLSAMYEKGKVDLSSSGVDTEEEAIEAAIADIQKEEEKEKLAIEEAKNGPSRKKTRRDKSSKVQFLESESRVYDFSDEDRAYSDQPKNSIHTEEIIMKFNESDDADESSNESDEADDASQSESSDSDESNESSSEQQTPSQSQVDSSRSMASPDYSRRRAPDLKRVGNGSQGETTKASKKKRKRSVKLEEVEDDPYIPEKAKEAIRKKKMAKAKRGAGSKLQDDGNEKREIERNLTGYALRKESIRKLALKKIREKKFKGEIKLKSIADEEEYKKRLEEKQAGMKNEDKRRKLATKPNKKISVNAEDTDPEEDLDMTPEYLRGRDTFEDELEDRVIKKKPYYKQNVMRGQCRGVKGWFYKKVANTQETSGVFKCITVLQTPDFDAKEVYEKHKHYLEPTSLVCRIYILKAKSLTPQDSKNSDPYLFIKCGGTTINDEKNVIEDTNNAGFYKAFEIAASIPGASTLTIQVWDDDGVVGDDLIGETKIDLEERYFSTEWQAFNKPDKKMPIEERTLTTKTSAAPQGVLECWVELLTPKQAKEVPPVDVRPFPRQPFELRVIVWGTKDVKFKDSLTEANDLYVKGKFGTDELETDTHWRCREAGSFNWRWKWKLDYPFDYDEEYGRNILTLSLWDRDITKSNEMICETRLDLNDYNMLTKSYKRNDKVAMKKIHPKSKKKTDRMWLMLTHPECRDKRTGDYLPQGFIEISVEVLPIKIADKLANGFGQEAPNMYPVLPKPTGRFSFDLFSPWKMLKELLGKKLAVKVVIFCC